MAATPTNDQKAGVAVPRHEFYQSETHITVVVWQSGVQENELRVSVVNDHFLFNVTKPDGSQSNVELDLAHPVGENIQIKIGQKKVEIKIPKRDCISWTKLEKVSGLQEPLPASIQTNAATVGTSIAEGAKSGPPSYPSSSKKAANWSAFEKQVAAEEAEEKPQDEAALNALFQKIYADADDDTKRAMVKSFVESNGTVLSTDWNKVGQKAVKTKPPSGMEYREWQQ